MKMKHKMFKMITITMVILFAFTFSINAGGKKEKPAEVSRTGSAEFDAWLADVRQNLGGTEIEIAIATDPSFDAMKKMMPDFEQRTSIKVLWDEMEETALMNKLLLEVAAGESDYDATLSYTEWVPMFENAGMLVPLEGWFADKENTPAWYDAEDIFEQYNIKVPTTYDELLAAAKCIDENVPNMAGISMRTRLG